MLSIKAKVMGLAFLVLVAIIMALVVSNAVKNQKVKALESQVVILSGEINNLKVREKINVASSNSKTELAKAKANVAGTGTKDRDNLRFVPDSAILMQLQSDPF